MMLPIGRQAGTLTHLTRSERHSAVIGQTVVLIREKFQFIRKMSLLPTSVAGGFQCRLVRKIKNKNCQIPER